MREIKFRAWNVQKKQMYYATPYRGYIKSNGSWWALYNGDDVEVANSGFDKLMQYTGLKDKNGVEIYEGDVLFHPLQGRRKVFYPYSETVASYGLRDIDNGFGSTLQDSHAIWEVIGNIYEHPELLKESKHE